MTLSIFYAILDNTMQREQLVAQPLEALNDQAPDFEYEQLADPDLRYEYVRLTEKLIAKALYEDKDELVFLDKSARPVAWFVRSLWPTLGFKEFDENGKPVIEPMPDMKFLNIDREQWEPMMGRSEGKDGEGITLKYVPEDTIDSLTGLMAERILGPNEYVSNHEPTFFDNKNILIVDEVSASGDTLRMAQALLGKAFKKAASIEGVHWMAPEKIYDKKSGGTKNARLPIWYSDSTPFGRLVGNRDSVKSRRSFSARQQRGGQFLSTRFNEPDRRGIALRKEITQLGKDVANGNMPVVPSRDRPVDDAYHENYMQYINRLSSKEFSSLRQQAAKEKIPFSELVREYKADRIK